MSFQFLQVLSTHRETSGRAIHINRQSRQEKQSLGWQKMSIFSFVFRALELISSSHLWLMEIKIPN